MTFLWRNCEDDRMRHTATHDLPPFHKSGLPSAEIPCITTFDIQATLTQAFREQPIGPGMQPADLLRRMQKHTLRSGLFAGVGTVHSRWRRVQPDAHRRAIVGQTEHAPAHRLLVHGRRRHDLLRRGEGLCTGLIRC